QRDVGESRRQQLLTKLLDIVDAHVMDDRPVLRTDRIPAERHGYAVAQRVDVRRGDDDPSARFKNGKRTFQKAIGVDDMLDDLQRRDERRPTTPGKLAIEIGLEIVP